MRGGKTSEAEFPAGEMTACKGRSGAAKPDRVKQIKEGRAGENSIQAAGNREIATGIGTGRAATIPGGTAKYPGSNQAAGADRVEWTALGSSGGKGQG